MRKRKADSGSWERGARSGERGAGSGERRSTMASRPIGEDFFGGATRIVPIKWDTQQNAFDRGCFLRSNGVIEWFVEATKIFLGLYPKTSRANFFITHRESPHLAKHISNFGSEPDAKRKVEQPRITRMKRMWISAVYRGCGEPRDSRCRSSCFPKFLIS